MTTRLLLIRHGETDWNVEKRYQGQEDPPLNRRGRDQACLLAEELSGEPLHVLYGSPLKRAWETAQIIRDRLAIPLHDEPRLKEIHLGDWGGRLAAEVAVRDAERHLRWEADAWSVAPPGGESLFQVRERVHAAADEIVPRHDGRAIGIVAHRIPLALLKIRYMKIDPSFIRRHYLPNAGWEEVVLDSREETRRHPPRLL
jgi:broad specificity phosphatase PhoE